MAIFHYTRMFGRSSQSFVRNATRETEAIYALPQIFDMTMFVCVWVWVCVGVCGAIMITHTLRLQQSYGTLLAVSA